MHAITPFNFLFTNISRLVKLFVKFVDKVENIDSSYQYDQAK